MVKSYLNFPCTPDLNLDVVIFSTLMIMHCFLHFVRQVFFCKRLLLSLDLVIWQVAQHAGATPESFFLVHVHQCPSEDLKHYLVDQLLDDYRVSRNMIRRCTRVLLHLASPLTTHISPTVTRPFTGIAFWRHRNVHLNEFFYSARLILIAVLVLVDLLFYLFQIFVLHPVGILPIFD